MDKRWNSLHLLALQMKSIDKISCHARIPRLHCENSESKTQDELLLSTIYLNPSSYGHSPFEIAKENEFFLLIADIIKVIHTQQIHLSFTCFSSPKNKSIFYFIKSFYSFHKFRHFLSLCRHHLGLGTLFITIWHTACVFFELLFLKRCTKEIKEKKY